MGLNATHVNVYINEEHSSKAKSSPPKLTLGRGPNAGELLIRSCLL